MNPLKTAATAAVLSTAVLTATLPAVAITIPSSTVALRAAVVDDVMLAQATRSARQRDSWPGSSAAGQVLQGRTRSAPSATTAAATATTDSAAKRISPACAALMAVTP